MPVLPIAGVHHVKLPVANLGRSRRWYEPVLGLHIHREFRDSDGTVRGVAGSLTDPSGATVIALALRENPEVAAGMSGFDPLALSVADPAGLQAWTDHLTDLGLPSRSPDNRTACCSFMIPTG